MRGRKSKQESRAQEYREHLIAWKQTPESLRPSLRELARELGTSHQLLQHYLDGLEEWEFKERYHRAKEKALEKAVAIRARAEAEGREMTMRECLEVMVTPGLHDQIERIRQDAKRGPVHPAEFKMMKLFVKQGLPGAQEVLQKCAAAGLKKRKRFAAIVKETPRREDEMFGAWVRRIWDECDKYDTTIPPVLTEELLEKYTGVNAKDRADNLPQILSQNAKSFRSGGDEAGNSAKAEGGKADAQL